MSVPIITLTGTLKKPNGAACSGFIDFVPNIEIQDSIGNILVPTVPITVALDVNGHFSTSLYATNSPDASQTGVVYRVIERVNEQPDHSYDIVVNYNAPGGTVDLADIAPPISGTPQYIYASAVELASHETDPNAHGGVLAPGGLGTDNLWTGTNTWTGPENHSGTVTYTGSVNFGGNQINTGDVYFRSGRPWIDVRAYGATGDGTTDDTAAIQTSIAALGNASGVLFFPKGTYKCVSQLVFDTMDGVTLRGSGLTDGSGSVLLFTGTGSGTFISAKRTSGFRIDGLSIKYNNAGFTGDLVDLTGPVAGQPAGQDTSFTTIENCELAGQGVAGARSLVLMRGGEGHVFRRVHFSGSRYALIGRLVSGDWANAITVSDQCWFDTISIAPISNIGTGWTVSDSVFEPLVGGATPNTPVVVVQDSSMYVQGLMFSGNWIGDSQNGGGTVLTLSGVGITITGNYIAVNNTCTLLASNSAIGLRGLSITGNEYGTNAQSYLINFAVFGAYSNIFVAGNYITGFGSNSLYTGSFIPDPSTNIGVFMQDQISAGNGLIFNAGFAQIRTLQRGAGLPQFQWGHPNTNFRATLDSFSSSGHPFLSLHAEHSTTANTIKNDGTTTRGFVLTDGFQAADAVSFLHGDSNTANANWGTPVETLRLLGADAHAAVEVCRSMQNYVRFEGNGTTLPPKVLGTGTDGNVTLDIAGKGTGNVRLNYIQGSGGVVIGDGASNIVANFTKPSGASANYLQFTGGNAGANTVSISALGSDTDINPEIKAKGAGRVYLNVFGGGGTGGFASGDGAGSTKFIVDSTGAMIRVAGQNVTWTSGSGSPNGVITANPGSIYTNTSGGAGATLWVKESGSATNTGWIAK